MVPIPATASAPNALSTGESPTTPIVFDGIAMFTVLLLNQFTDGFQDPYYIEVVEPEEKEFLDKAGPGSGVVASVQGKIVDIMHRGKSAATTDREHDNYRKNLRSKEGHDRPYTGRLCQAACESRNDDMRFYWLSKPVLCPTILHSYKSGTSTYENGAYMRYDLPCSSSKARHTRQ